MGSLEIDNLTKTFGEEGETIVAVEDLTFNINDGEFIVLVGPSGCGKSTTLRCVAGLESPSDGDIRLNKESILGSAPKHRNIAMVFQSYALYPHMTARENMSFGLKMTTDLSAEEIDGRVEQTASTMGIKNLLEDKPAELSGGQQQRVALGRAIVREPEVFLMDEPLSNLDAKLRSQMRTELQELQQSLDVTTIYVTHDQTEAMTMGDRIAVLDGGKLQQIGTPLECYHRPANEFVAGFIGSPSMNFFDVAIKEVNNGIALTAESFEYSLSENTLFDTGDIGRGLTLGIRPEDIQVLNEPSEHSFSVKVSVTEPLGEVTYVYFDLAGNSCTASIEGDLEISENNQVHVSFPEGSIHLFDESGDTVKSRENVGQKLPSAPV